MSNRCISPADLRPVNMHACKIAYHMTCFRSRPDVIPFPLVSAQVLYGILVQHFANLSGASPVPAAHLDAMIPPLLLMTSEVPFYAATVARARLTRLNDRLTAAGAGTALPSISKKALAVPSSKQQQHRALVAGQQGGNAQDLAATAGGESPWPGPRALLQLKLFSTLFPSSDRRHPVLSPACLLAGRTLLQCIASDIGKAFRGLIMAWLALHMAAPA